MADRMLKDEDIGASSAETVLEDEKVGALLAGRVLKDEDVGASLLPGGGLEDEEVAFEVVEKYDFG